MNSSQQQDGSVGGASQSQAMALFRLAKLMGQRDYDQWKGEIRASNNGRMPSLEDIELMAGIYKDIAESNSQQVSQLKCGSGSDASTPTLSPLRSPPSPLPVERRESRRWVAMLKTERSPRIALILPGPAPKNTSSGASSAVRSTVP